MIAVMIIALVVVDTLVGILLGFVIGVRVTSEALKLARYAESIRILRDLVNTPDATDLRLRAQEVLNAHRRATARGNTPEDF